MKNCILIILLVLSYWTVLLYFEKLELSHILLALIPLAFLLSGHLTNRKELKKFSLFLWPIVLTLLVYNGMKFFAHIISANAHVIEPYVLEKKLFGISSGSMVLTPNEIFLNWTHPVLDFVCGLAYFIYAFVFFALCLYIYFKNERNVSLVATWSFFATNMLGYITYYIYAAAPPWYVSKYGLNPVADLTTPPHAAGALRFDTVVGFDLMKGVYENGSIVFGAIPSLHAAYPFLTFLFALHIKKFRVSSFLFFMLICFSAVYLNHHYIIDLIIGALYALIVFTLAVAISRRKGFIFS